MSSNCWEHFPFLSLHLLPVQHRQNKRNHRCNDPEPRYRPEVIYISGHRLHRKALYQITADYILKSSRHITRNTHYSKSRTGSLPRHNIHSHKASNDTIQYACGQTEQRYIKDIKYKAPSDEQKENKRQSADNSRQNGRSRPVTLEHSV